MKKLIIIVLLALSNILGYTQTVDPVLLEEIGRCRDYEKIRVFVIMRQQYDQQQLNRLAAHFMTRSERREFVVNELKQFAEASQYDLRHYLSELQRGNLVSEPKTLWIANAIFFEATREAILFLADRADILVIGFDEERNWLPDGEESYPANQTRLITSNVTQVNANQVWNLGYTGQGVVVAVIDTGVNYNHLDLADHLWDGGTEFPYHGYDIYNNDNNPMDDHGHGTHCAGTICGDGTAGLQTGMAPDATLMCVKCLSSGGSCSDLHIISAMQWAVDHGCDVISMSLGGHGHSVSEKTIIRNACVNVLNAGVIASVSAGNEGSQLSSYPIPDNIGLPGGCPPPYLDPEQELNPGGLSCSVCVGAVDWYDEAAYFTSQGPRSWSDCNYADYPYVVGGQTEFGLIRPDVCAPGVSIVSANYSNTSGYITKSGTSMAAPCVAGCMALMLSKNNNTTPENLCRILEETAVPLSTGKSNIYGYGRVDVLAAINAMSPLLLESIAVNDAQGNNDGKLNAGEDVTLDLTLLNDSGNALDDVTIVLSTGSEYVNITNGTATLPHFDAGQTQTIENIFGFTLCDGAPGNRAIKFAIEAFMDGESMGNIRFDVMVYGYYLRFDEVTVLNDNNGNGLLEAGETADLHVVISNIGNESATSLMGVLTTSFPYLSINDTTGFFGDIGFEGQASADFNVTLANSVPEIYKIDLSLGLVDNNEKHTNLDFELLKGIIVFDDANVKTICVSLWDTNGDGELSYVEAAAVTYLGSAFRGNSVISSFDEFQYFIGLTYIGSFAFYCCSGLTSIKIPNSVTSIGTFAFYGCSGLTSIEIPNSVTSIGGYSFFLCTGLTSMSVWRDNPPTLGNDYVFYSVNKSIPVYVPCGAMEAYQNATGWSEFTNTISMCSSEVSVTVNSSEGGMVTGDGYYDAGEICTLTAIANQGYTFINWTMNGVEISNAEIFSFTVTGDVSIVANFERGVVVIGYGTLSHECLPSYSYFKYSLSQQIYTADEIGREGTITKIAFFNSGATKTRNYNIYMVSTEKAAFESSNDWITVTEGDLVYGGEVTMVANNWAMLQLDTPFRYDGVSNIALVVDDNSWNYTSWPSMTCRVFETQVNQTICVNSDNTNFNPMNPSYYGTLMNVKNQIILGFTPTFTKEISAYTTHGGYYLLSFPVGEVTPEEVEHMLDNNYDLYAFDEGKELEWINYKNPDNEFTSLIAGKGYLYANSGNVILSLTSWPYNGNGEVTLSKIGDANTAGWNLVGNPFAVSAYIDHDFYVMNTDGSEIVAAERNYVEPMEGVFVVAEDNGETLTFSASAPTRSPRLILNLSQGQGTSMSSSIIDRAIIRFGESRMLPKLQIKENSAKLFIQQSNKYYAVVNASDVGELSVSFKAVEDGIYTLCISNEDVKFSYLHLIDTLTGNDIDLLATSKNPVAIYTFEAKTMDDVSRFRLVFHVESVSTN